MLEAWAGLSVSVLSIATVLALGTRASLAAGLALRTLGWVGLVLIVHGCGWRAHAPRRLAAAVAAGVVGLLAAAVVVPPIESGDVWSYAMYGRIVAVHHASPYRHLPDEYPSDPFLARMDAVYHHTPSRYGPLFAAVADGGHSDGLVGLALLGAVLVADRRPALAGSLLGAAVLVKATAVLALAGLAAWLLHRRRRAVAARCAGAGALVVLVGSAVAGGSATLTPLRQARLEVSKASVWHWLHRAAGGEISAVAGAVALVAGALLVLRALREREPAGAGTAPLVAYLLVGAYVLPWYVFWVLPALIATGLRRLAVFFVALAALFQLAELPGPRHAAEPVWLHRLQNGALYGAVPVVEAGATLVLLIASGAGLRGRASSRLEPST